MLISFVDALVCRLGRVRLSRERAGAVAVLRGNGGTLVALAVVLALALAPALALGGISVVRRGRLSGVIGEDEGPPI